jgi:hypothetical protein
MGDRLTVYYDGSCPICSREIGFYRARPGADGFDWVNVAGDGAEVLGPVCPATRPWHGCTCAEPMARSSREQRPSPKCGGVCLGSECWVRCFRYRRSWRSLNWATASF